MSPYSLKSGTGYEITPQFDKQIEQLTELLQFCGFLAPSERLVPMINAEIIDQAITWFVEEVLIPLLQEGREILIVANLNGAKWFRDKVKAKLKEYTAISPEMIERLFVDVHVTRSSRDEAQAFDLEANFKKWLIRQQVEGRIVFILEDVGDECVTIKQIGNRFSQDFDPQAIERGEVILRSLLDNPEVLPNQVFEALTALIRVNLTEKINLADRKIKASSPELGFFEINDSFLLGTGMDAGRKMQELRVIFDREDKESLPTNSMFVLFNNEKLATLASLLQMEEARVKDEITTVNDIVRLIPFVYALATTTS